MIHTPQSPVPRREFLRLLGAIGGAAVLNGFLAACERAGISSSPDAVTTTLPERTATSANPTPRVPPTNQAQPTTAPAPTQEVSVSPTAKSNLSRIALVRSDDRSEGVRKAIDLFGANPVANRKVFIKPNYNSADPAPGSTHPDVLRALVLKLREMGAGEITVGDRSGMGETRAVMETLGVMKMAEELKFKVLVFDELAAKDWVHFDPPGRHWKDGFYFARPCLESEAAVQACCLKTHRYGGHFTLSLKNSVGLAAKYVPGDRYNYMRELHGSPDQRRMIAEINQPYQPALIVMDAVEGFSDGGPDRGTLIHPGVVLAGSDRVAMDAVGVAILRSFGTTREVSQGGIFQQEQIARAVELGLGANGPEQIELVTGDQESADFAGELGEILRQG